MTSEKPTRDVLLGMSNVVIQVDPARLAPVQAPSVDVVYIPEITRTPGSTLTVKRAIRVLGVLLA
jgi:hypothetical protein